MRGKVAMLAASSVTTPISAAIAKTHAPAEQPAEIGADRRGADRSRPRRR